jgi:hypothetical protein
MLTTDWAGELELADRVHHQTISQVYPDSNADLRPAPSPVVERFPPAHWDGRRHQGSTFPFNRELPRQQNLLSPGPKIALIHPA